MRIQPIDGITLYFDDDQQEFAELFTSSCRKSAALIRQDWGLNPPHPCRVYIMTSWQRFLFGQAPWPLRIGAAISFPFIYFRYKKMWSFVAGLTLPYKPQPTVGIKPPPLAARADTTIGGMIFIKEPDINLKAELTLCHELVHAFAAHLQLPLWLNEGLATVAAERYKARPMVRPETLQLLGGDGQADRPASYRNLMGQDNQRIAYNYIRGYWITRYLAETQPDTLKALLGKHHRSEAIIRRLSDLLSIKPLVFWQEIDAIVKAHFDANPEQA